MSLLSKLQEAWANPPQGPSLIGAAKAAWEAAQTPGKAYNEGMTPDEMIKAGNDFAMTMGMGGSLVPKPGNSLGMFGGRLAKTADLNKLAQAERLEKAGARPDDIWKMTGWGKGADGQWRFEIPDNKATLNTDKLSYKGQIAGNVVDHPELYAAYPELQFGTISRTPKGAKYNGGRIGDHIEINPDAPDPRSTMLHEMQHGVQDLEGFAKGGGKSWVKSALAEQLAGRPNALKLLQKADDWELYRKLAGETEARSVQKRQDYTPLQRRLRSPWMDEDVPRQKQLLLGQKSPMQAAMAEMDPIEQANRTARSAGAVGAKAITPRYVQESVQPGETVLNFGAGKPDKKTNSYLHSDMIREKGGVVDEYDFGSNSVGKLGNQYDTVFASNVLNVQNGRPMLQDTLKQIKNSTKGRAVFNYPQSPRYMELTPDEVAAEIKNIFGVEPKRVGGTKQAPLWEVRTGTD